jgi:hypothetical protein
MNSIAPKHKTKEEGCRMTRKSPFKEAVLARVVMEHVDLPMDDYANALCNEE